MPVSRPFRTRSSQVDAWQIDSMQDPSMQSLPALQRDPFAQGAHPDPPQSMSVSDESWTPLLQEAVAHFPFTQAAVAQSAPIEHCLPLSQRGHMPPQSTSVSVPFFVESVQPSGGAWHAEPVSTKPGSHRTPHRSPKHVALPCSVDGHGVQEESAQPFSGSASTQSPAHSFSEAAQGGAWGPVGQPGMPSQDAPPHESPVQFEAPPSPAAPPAEAALVV